MVLSQNCGDCAQRIFRGDSRSHPLPDRHLCPAHGGGPHFYCQRLLPEPRTKITLDLGLAGIHLLSVIVAVFVGTGLVNKENRKTYRAGADCETRQSGRIF